jgi:drug/metabolite transporter (DMT)-like permease
LAVALAGFSALCIGLALITGRVGLRALDARAGAAISIPTATLLFVLAAPLALDVTQLRWPAVALFAAVGVFFPAAVTLLTFRSNELLGPTVTSAVSGTAPLFALLAAGALLGERVPVQAIGSAAGVVLGVALLSRHGGSGTQRLRPRALVWPLAGALVRGLAQVGAKAGLSLWASPFAACLIGYMVSSATVVSAERLRLGVRPRPTPRGVAWFAATGTLNGAGLLLMYAALTLAPVWTVAPIVATYPLITALFGALLLRDERLTWPVAIGGLITVTAIMLLVGAPRATT